MAGGNTVDDIDEGFDQAQIREVDNTAQVSILLTNYTYYLLKVFI